MWPFKLNVERMKKKQDVPGLIRALKGPDFCVRAEAEKAMRSIAQSRSWPLWVGPYGGGSYEQYLESAGSLLGVLNESNDTVRAAMVDALVYINEPYARQLFYGALRNGNANARVTAIWALEHIGVEGPAEPFICALQNSNADVRRCAASMLYRIGDASAEEPLIHALNDSNPGVRRCAASALEKIVGTASTYPLIRGPGDSAADARRIEPFNHALDDDKRVIRFRAIWLFEKIREKRKIRALVRDLTNRNQFSGRSRRNAGDALAELGSAAVGPIIRAFRRSPGTVCEYSVEALVNIGDAAVLPLIRALKDSNEAVRNGAASALGGIGDAIAVVPLIAALQGDGYIGNVIEALGKFRDPRAVESLIGVLKDKHYWQAAKALGSIGDVRAVMPLVAALDDSNEMTRQYAVRALGKIPDARAVEPLIGVLMDSNWLVRKYAAAALGYIGDTRAIGPLISALNDTELTEAVQSALLSLVEHAATTLSPNDLRLAASMQNTYRFYLDVRAETCGGGNSGCDVWFTRIKQLARQELIRRGLGA
jgi:HEAT repeat protein